MTIIAGALSIALLVMLPQAPVPCPVACVAGHPQPRVVRLKLYNQSRLRQADVDALLEVANSIWIAYGVTLELGTDADAIALVLTKDKSSPPASTTVVLGTTLFTRGHATPYIRLSPAAAEAFAEEEGGISFNAAPPDKRDAMLTRMLGIALAHELAHYLLDTAQHSTGGLLQPSLSIQEMAFPEAAHLRLTRKQQRLLCPAAVSGQRP
jgi:hypothetical protein